MAIPGNGSVLTTASLYRLTAPGSASGPSTVRSLLGLLAPALGSPACVAEPLSLCGTAMFAVADVDGLAATSIAYPGSDGAMVTIPNVTLIDQGATGFTFASSDGGTYFLSNAPIGGAAIAVNRSRNVALAGLAPQLDRLVGANSTVYVGATNTPDALDGQPSFACVLRGTLIATPDGEVPVEALRIGTRVLTGSGDAKPVLWVGRRSYAAAFVGRNPKLLPVRISAGALDENRPRRDLLLSPGQAVLVDDMLVRAAELVNGTTIIQTPGLPAIDYFHVEIEDHDVIVAEGVSCETFVDHDSRAAFQNADEYFALYPERDDAAPIFCAPRVVEGPVLDRVRARLAARAATRELQRAA